MDISTMLSLLFLLGATALQTVESRRLFRRIYKTRGTGQDGHFLTPFIDKMDVRTARQASVVKILKSRANVTAYSGFITTNKECQANLFFVYMKASINPEHAPLMVYLQGGPGKSSMFGQFLESGPLAVDSNGKLHRRPHTVQKIFNVVYVDQPAGAGFSFTKCAAGYARSSADCAKGLREFLRQLLIVFPELRNRPLYVAGESYGSRVAVALAHSLLTNPDPAVPLKLSGVIACSPVLGKAIDLLDSADSLYHMGMLDPHGRRTFSMAIQRVRDMWGVNHTGALYLLSHTIFSLHPTPSAFCRLTGYQDHASLLSDRKPAEFVQYYRYMQKPLLKRSLHLSSHAQVDIKRLRVILHLAKDFTVDLRDQVQALLEATRMLVFSGQLDTVFPVVKQEAYMLSLNWTGGETLRKAPRKHWYEEGPGSRLLGYVKKSNDLTYVVLTRAGHHAWADASETVSKMVERFASGVDVLSPNRKVKGVN